VSTTRVHRLRRYADLLRLVARHGGTDLLRGLDGDEALLPEDEGDVAEDARRLADDLERMGPAFVKLGQLLSTRPDLLPGPYIEALRRDRKSVV